MKEVHLTSIRLKWKISRTQVYSNLTFNDAEVEQSTMTQSEKVKKTWKRKIDDGVPESENWNAETAPFVYFHSDDNRSGGCMHGITLESKASRLLYLGLDKKTL